MSKLLKTLEDLTYKYGPYVLLALVVVGFFMFRKKLDDDNSSLDRKGKKTICKVHSIGIDARYRDVAKYHYYVNGHKYNSSKGLYSNEIAPYLGVGDFFELEYLPSEPEIERVNLLKRIAIKDLSKYIEEQSPLNEDITVKIDKYGREMKMVVTYSKVNLIGKKISNTQFVHNGKLYDVSWEYKRGPQLEKGDTLRIKALGDPIEIYNIYFDDYDLILTSEK